MLDVIPQPYPLYGYRYIFEDLDRPNQTGPVSLVVGWVKHPDPDAPLIVHLVPLLADLSAPTGATLTGEELFEATLFRVFTTLAEAEAEHDQARYHDAMDRLAANPDDPFAKAKAELLGRYAE